MGTEREILIEKAKLGDLKYINELGYYYDSVENDIDKAIDCFKKGLELHSCNCNNPSCGVSTMRCNLACKLYEKGNIDEAEKHFEQSAKQNNPSANFYMGRIYEKENNIFAINFYATAARHGHLQAIEWFQDNMSHYDIMNPYDIPPYTETLAKIK